MNENIIIPRLNSDVIQVIKNAYLDETEDMNVIGKNAVFTQAFFLQFK